MGPIPLGGAVLTGAGRLPCKALIHVAGISLWWRASEASIGRSVHSAMRLVNEHGFASVAFPLIGASTGGFGSEGSLRVMLSAFKDIESAAEVTIVCYPD